MEYIIRHQFRHINNYYVTTFFQSLYDKLKIQYPQHTFTIVNDQSYESRGYGSIYSCMNFSIINPLTEKYIVVSFFDNWKYHFMKHLGWDPSKMVKFFYPGGFNYMDYFNFRHIEKDNRDIDCPINIESIYQPIFYGPYESESEDLMDSLYDHRKLEESEPLLYFKGYMWDFRKNMTNDISDSSILVYDKNGANKVLCYREYLQELSQYRCALSLPGGTEVCNRDIECFGVGVPVLRPYLDINYPEPLVSNYHYINIYKDCKYWDGNPHYISYKDFVDNLQYTWNKVKSNIEYLKFISTNARKWFVKNCSLENNLQYLLTQISLETL